MYRRSKLNSGGHAGVATGKQALVDQVYPRKKFDNVNDYDFSIVLH